MTTQSLTPQDFSAVHEAMLHWKPIGIVAAIALRSLWRSNKAKQEITYTPYELEEMAKANGIQIEDNS